MIILAAWFIAVYLAGSVNFSIVLFKLIGRGDPRNRFSGNAGTMNVYRQAGILPASLVLVGDMARAMGIAYFGTRHLAADFVPWICLALIIGNRFPCFHHFKGGKGVANYLGFTLVIAPVAAFISMLAWVVVYRLSRYPFIASLIMTAILAVGTCCQVGCHAIPGAGVLCTVAFVYYNHRSNVREWMRSAAEAAHGRKKGDQSR